jgi:hypothetical protein
LIVGVSVFSSFNPPPNSRHGSDLSLTASFLNLVPVIIFLGIAGYAFYFQSFGRHKRSPLFNQPVSFLVSDSGVHLKTPRVESQLQWELFPSAVEGKDGFLLMQIGKKTFNWLPKDGFDSFEFIARCREILRRNVKESSGLLK